MPLEEYRRKRDFRKTPEPEGTVAPAGGGRFVVQRHRATRLHYDLRFEIDGVLVSWAVPRGPTLDAGQRRMAVHVEDHPLDYFDFEGVIPKGEYGAGDVIVWDWGTFEPEETDDPGEAVRGGELKFRLDGEKLHGRFTLVRTGGGDRGRGRSVGYGESGQEQWLLIKKRGADAVEGWDAEDHPQSVKTGRTNDEVKENRDALWDGRAPAAQAEIDLSAARPEPMPDFIPPMLATLAPGPFSDPDWLFEIKWDGFRVETVVRRDGTRLWTRNRNDAASYFPSLGRAKGWIRAEEAIVDGEVVALDEDGRPDFGLLQQMLTEQRPSAPIVYQAFDLLHLDGRSLLGVPLEDRKRLLRSVLRAHPLVRFAAHHDGDGKAFHDAAERNGLEGIVAKERRSRYEPGRRARTWLKIKIRPEQELVVGGWLPGEGSHRELGALLVGVHEDGRLRYAGRVGSGIDTKMRRRLRERLDELQRDTAPFQPAPPRTGDLRAAVWAEPDLVIRANYANWTRDGIIRAGSFKGLEPGRDPREVTRERSLSRAEAKAAIEAPPEVPRAEPSAAAAGGSAGDRPTFSGATPEELEALDRLGAEGTWTVGGQSLKLTNLDKVLFPGRPDDETPVSKRDLIRYFATIGPAMLPHLEGRPLNLQRFPNGIDKPAFWQKDLRPTDPDWLTRWTEIGVDDRGANTHLVADRVASLAWLGNQAAFEVHAWTSRLEAPDRPTFALIDIDPGEQTTWAEVLALARLFRTAIGHLGLRAYPKTTGKRGLQVWIPIRPIYGFHDTTAWVEQLSRAVGSIVPDLVSWEWAKSSRRGRARLDYTQNSRIKTLVAPYAVRPAPAAPVSTPITWEELDDPELRSDRWTIRTLPARVAERGDLFADAQVLDQELPPL